jgi:hypothetical protein
MFRRILVIMSYLLVAAAIMLTTILLVAYGQGYGYDFKTHRFELNSLMVFNSSPQGATIVINGKTLTKRTPYRATFVAGSYDVEVKKDGYRPWRKTVVVNPPEVSFLSTIVLVPNELTIDTLTPDDNVSHLAASPDHRHLAYVSSGPTPGAWLVSPDRRQPTKLLTPRAATADQPAEVIQDLSWSNDSSHLLVRTQIGTTNHYLVVASNGGATTDLTQLFKFDLAGLQFNPNDWRELYWISPEGLRRLNVEAQTVSAVLAEKVSGFTFAGDRLVYVQTTALGKTVLASDHNGRDPKRLIESVPESEGYELQYASYRGKDLLAVLPTKTNIATVHADVFSATPVAQVISKTAQHLSFSSDGQYLVAYNADGFVSYDFDKDKLSTATFDGGKLTALSWFDAQHLLLTQAGFVKLVEADGGNLTELGPTDRVTAAFATSDQRRVIWLTTQAGTGKVVMVEVKR